MTHTRTEAPNTTWTTQRGIGRAAPTSLLHQKYFWKNHDSERIYDAQARCSCCKYFSIVFFSLSDSRSKTWITVQTPPNRLQMHRRLGSHALQKPQIGGEHGADRKLAIDMVRTVGRRRTWMFMLQTLFHCVYSTRSDSRSRTWITVRATARSTSNSSTIGKSSPAEAAGRRRTWG
jgi:hypothetical protein